MRSGSPISWPIVRFAEQVDCIRDASFFVPARGKGTSLSSLRTATGNRFITDLFRPPIDLPFGIIKVNAIPKSQPVYPSSAPKYARGGAGRSARSNYELIPLDLARIDIPLESVDARPTAGKNQRKQAEAHRSRKRVVARCVSRTFPWHWSKGIER